MVTANFPHLEKETDIQILEAQRALKKMKTHNNLSDKKKKK